jgi:hypothetical protein
MPAHIPSHYRHPYDHGEIPEVLLEADFLAREEILYGKPVWVMWLREPVQINADSLSDWKFWVDPTTHLVIRMET